MHTDLEVKPFQSVFNLGKKSMAMISVGAWRNLEDSFFSAVLVLPGYQFLKRSNLDDSFFRPF